MKRLFIDAFAVLIYPHKLFMQLGVISNNRYNDVYLFLLLSFVVFPSIWAFSMLAGIQRQGVLLQSVVIFVFGTVMIMVIAILGRGWAKYIKWSANRFARVEAQSQTIYRVFVYALTPLIFKFIALVLPFLTLFFTTTLPFVPLFSFLDGLASWALLWIFLLQWLGLVKALSLDTFKALVLILMPVIIIVVLFVVISLLLLIGV